MIRFKDEKADALRRAWYEMIVSIGYGDVAAVSRRLSASGEAGGEDKATANSAVDFEVGGESPACKKRDSAVMGSFVRKSVSTIASSRMPLKCTSEVFLSLV